VIDTLQREVTMLRIEQEALRREPDPSTVKRAREVEHEIAEKQRKLDELNRVWNEERQALERQKAVKRQLDAARDELQRVSRAGDLARASELMYATIPKLDAGAYVCAFIVHVH
jgi:ATP-dependent Clp protease ATP-binding subunit ClpB